MRYRIPRIVDGGYVKTEMRPLNADAFLYINLPHNRWMTSAQQLMDERTTADMQAHNSCCAVHDSIFPNDRYYIFQQLILYLPTTYSGSSNNLSYIFQQLIPVLPAPLPISINTPIHFREQTEAHQYRTAKA